MQVEDGLGTEDLGQFNGLVARYDTTAPFSSAASFDVFDTTTLNRSAAGFAGGAFDGAHVYFAPYASNGNASFDNVFLA